MIDGGRGHDELVGGDGDDRILGRGGDDYLDGGPGRDVLGSFLVYDVNWNDGTGKWGLDCADALYAMAPVRAGAVYRISYGQ